MAHIVDFVTFLSFCDALYKNVHVVTEREFFCDMQNIADRLKEIRKDLGIAQEEMAKVVGTKFRTWQRYEAGSSLPKLQYLVTLAEKGYDVNWLLTGEGSIKKVQKDNALEPDSLLIDAAAWFLQWSQENKFSIDTDKYPDALRWCYDAVLKEKKVNPDITSTELRDYLRKSLSFQLLLNR
ncbi:helix-turn-helix domain-containing protein [Terasakiella sp. A23]|uniref:helix-turn-helix domain-containing protein n=1 Tax=Terasakiella sp. FCG-A23 TaxID=3080561 RepID=UPI0029538CDE|nr:helix-turn-helix domain-containing protein [Terasakiella sp. A23]MDV7341011.1 helix-turn-helix domain-containing protein [Terasakiella sp. A23]